MKKAIFLLGLILFTITASFSQFVYKIKADSVLITNDSCNAELNLENSTRNVNGFLYNKGNGRTEFKKALINLGDSAFIIGGDTLNIGSNTYLSNLFHKQGGNSYGTTSIIGTKDDNGINVIKNNSTMMEFTNFGFSDVIRLPSFAASANHVYARANGTTIQSASYNGGTVLNIGISSSDSTKSSGIRFATHFNIWGTNDFIQYYIPYAFSRPGSYSALLSTNFSGLRLATLNTDGQGATPVFIDVNLVNKGYFGSDSIKLKHSNLNYGLDTTLYKHVARNTISGALVDTYWPSGSAISDGDKGDVTVSSSGTSWIIDNNVLSNAKIRQSAGLSLIGNSTNSTANVADITAASDDQVLRRSGTAIGFGAVNLAGSNAVTGVLPAANGGTNYTVQTLTDGSTITWNVANGINGVVTLGGTGRTLSITNPVAGQTYTIRINQDGTGNRTITTWPTGSKWPAGLPPALSTAASRVDIVVFYYDGSSYYGTYQQNFQ
jgi:hypothetical protein